ESSFEPLAKVARKIKGEIKYHVFHADIWLVKLGNGTEESKARMQSTLNMAWNYALGIFEEGDFESPLQSENIFAGEKELQKRWLEAITPTIEKANLKIPAEADWNPVLGGRKGYHTEHLDQLVNEMSEVFRIEPNTEW
ncbi:MAG: Phenylacetic acid catabolic protein, partial [Bacteroidota bacterium]